VRVAASEVTLYLGDRVVIHDQLFERADARQLLRDIDELLPTITIQSQHTHAASYLRIPVFLGLYAQESRGRQG